MGEQPGRHTSFYELAEAQEQAGCPICRLAERRTERYLDSLLYEAVLDASVRERLTASHGFCAAHVALLRQRPGRSLGIALIYQSILARMTELIDAGELVRGSLRDRLRGRRASGATLAERLCPQEQCPACTIHREAEESYAGLLASCLNDERLYLAYAEGDGLCLPHLAMALEQVPDPKALERLVQPQLARYRAMLSDLSEYIRKCDHRFRSEPFGSEGDVWLRAMNALAGGAGMGSSAKHGSRRAQDLSAPH